MEKFKLLPHPEHLFLMSLMGEKNKYRGKKSVVGVRWKVGITPNGFTKVITKEDLNEVMSATFLFDKYPHKHSSTYSITYNRYEKLEKKGYVTYKMLITQEEFSHHNIDYNPELCAVFIFELTDMGREATELQEAYKEL
jgi:hypothetical protein